MQHQREKENKPSITMPREHNKEKRSDYLRVIPSGIKTHNMVRKKNAIAFYGVTVKKRILMSSIPALKNKSRNGDLDVLLIIVIFLGFRLRICRFNGRILNRFNGGCTIYIASKSSINVCCRALKNKKERKK